MIKYRLNILLSTFGYCLDVAIDHGFFNEESFLNSIDDMEKAVMAVVDAHPDALYCHEVAAVLRMMKSCSAPMI